MSGTIWRSRYPQVLQRQPESLPLPEQTSDNLLVQREDHSRAGGRETPSARELNLGAGSYGVPLGAVGTLGQQDPSGPLQKVTMIPVVKRSRTQKHRSPAIERTMLATDQPKARATVRGAVEGGSWLEVDSNYQVCLGRNLPFLV
jgi:hypothetical protein